MAVLVPKGKNGNDEDAYYNQGYLTLGQDVELLGSLTQGREQLAHHILMLGDLHLPGDENLLLRAWIGGEATIHLGDGHEPLRFKVTMEQLRLMFRDREIRNHDIYKCLHNHILPDLRRIIADDPESQRLLTTVD